MTRYIDVGTACQHLTDRLMESAVNNVGIKADADEVFRDIAENRLPIWIDELPTYDVREVRHGHWEWNDYGGFGNYHCSVCRYIPYGKFSRKFHPDYMYCPRCGAKMDEAEK